jgi:hypothetical protein
LTTVTITQHLAGLVVGALVYLSLLKLDVPRRVATIAAGVVLLDSYAVTLDEQAVMAETFFRLFLVGSAFLAVAARRRPWTLALSGALLAAAVGTRTMGLFAIPIFVLYALWVLPAWRPRLLAVAGVAVPLLLYSGAQEMATGYFGMTEGAGWFLYGRVASLTSCSPSEVPPPTRRLCAVSGERGRARGFSQTADYVFNNASPAHRLFGGMYKGDAERRAYVNGLLRDWARAVIQARPRAYLAGVGASFSNYLRPGVRVDQSYLVASPGEPFFAGFTKLKPQTKTYITKLKAAHFPTYERDASAPAPLRAYQRWLEAPGWLLTGLSMLAVLVVAVGVVARRPLRHTKETLFLLTSSAAILVGAVAFSDFQDRFVPTLLPLLVIGFTLFLHAVVSAINTRRADRPAKRAQP